MDFYLTEYCSTHKMERAKGSRKGFLNPDLWGVMAFGPGFFNEVFFQPMQVMDPTNYQMKEVMKRIRRFNDRPEVQKNPTVKNWHEALEFFESPAGSRVGAVAEKIIKAATGLDFSFVRAASTENIYGKEKETTRKTDDAAEQFAKALAS